MKKIRIIFILLFSLNFGYINAQESNGIDFYNGTYKEAVEKAKSEKKHLFVDFYAKWCIPCKKMAKVVFTKEEVGKYFNEKFVSLKIDAEIPENAEIVKKYNIEAFPTMIFISNEEKALSVNVGALTDKELLEAAKIAVGEAIGFKQLYEEYKGDKNNLELQQSLLLKAPSFLSAQEDMEADKWLVRIQKLYKNYIKAKKGPSLINKNDYVIISTLGGNSDLEVEEMMAFINENLNEWKKEIGNTPCYYIVEHNDNKIEKLAKEGDAQYKQFIEKINTEYKDAYSIVEYKNISPYERANRYYTALYNLYNKRNINDYISVLSDLFNVLGDEITPNDYGKAAQDLYYAAGDNLKEEHHKTAITWVQNALKADNSMMDRMNYLVMIGDSYKELGSYDISKQYYNQAYLESLQMKDMEMAQQMIQATISRKLAVLELLQK